MSKKTINDLLSAAGEVVRARGENYGGIEDNFQLIADLSSLRLGRDIHPYEVAVILACVKNARSFASPHHEDSHVDAANYELFAATFAEDYVNRGAAPDVGYRRKADLKPAVVRSGQTPALEPLTPTKLTGRLEPVA